MEIFKQRKGPVTITPRDVNVQLFGDVAIVTAHLQDLPPMPVREPMMFPRRTFVLRRIAGRWLIVHLHASGFPLTPAKN
jgi:ketosteroid isomerase-like protein